MYAGGKKKIKIKRVERVEGKEVTQCSKCGGSGQLKRVSRSLLGQVVNIVECNDCNGTGIIGGREKKVAKIEFDIPKGASSGSPYVLENEGNQGVDKLDDGNLIIFFEEKKHSLFIREGNNIYLAAYINYHQAVQGSNIEVPTISGIVKKFKVPKGIKSGQIVKLKGLGMPDPRRRINGDQLVRINIKTSNNSSKDFILLMENMEEVLGNDITFSKFED